MEVSAQKTFERAHKSKFHITVGLAENTDGEDIKNLVSMAGFKDELDWSDIYPYWLIALHEAEVIGCLQVCPGKPVGRLEMLACKSSLTGVQRAQTVVRLVEQGIRTLKGIHGCQVAAGLLEFDQKSYKKLIKKRGGIVIATGNLMATRI